jgi:hypothetical protein
MAGACVAAFARKRRRVGIPLRAGAWGCSPLKGGGPGRKGMQRVWVVPSSANAMLQQMIQRNNYKAHRRAELAAHVRE